MFGIVVILFLITLVLLICWHEINPLHRVIEYIRKEAQYACDTDVSHYLINFSHYGLQSYCLFDYAEFFNKEVLYKEGSTRIGKIVRNSSTSSETIKESDLIKRR